MFLGLFDHHGKVAASTIFHQNVQNSGFAVNVTVVIAYNVLVVQVFKDVTTTKSVTIRASYEVRDKRHSHLGDNLLPVSLAHALKIELFACKYLKVEIRIGRERVETTY